jgi:hypothetical protein
MSSSVTGGAARASAPETETTPKQLFVRMNGPIGQQLPPLQVLRTFFGRFGRVVKITPAKNGTIAFVTFETPEEAKAALDAMNDHEVVVESNGARLVRTLFVDFALERGTKPIHVQAPRQAQRPAPVEAQRPAPVEAQRPAPVEAQRPAPVEAQRPAPVEAQRPAPVEAQRPAPVEAQRPAPRPAPSPATPVPVFNPSILSGCNDSIFMDGSPNSMKWLGPKTCLALFNIGRNPQPKVMYQEMQTLTLFSNGSPMVWYIPHPRHPYALTECLEGLDSGRFTHMSSVEIPSKVLEMPNCWRF